MHFSSKHWSPDGLSLQDFDPEVICRPAGATGAVLDTSFFDYPSDPDFSPSGHGASFAESAANCAQAVRRAAEEGRYSCLTGYTLQYRLMPHWARKVAMRELGLDVNAALRDAREACADWPFDGSWPASISSARHAEFFLTLLVAAARAKIATGEFTPAAAADWIRAEFEDEFEIRRPGLNDAVRARLEDRLPALLAAPASA